MTEGFLKAVLIYYAVINVLLFIFMGVDKLKAKKNQWRIQEKTLLIIALLGGGIGGLLGQKLFRHKSKKWYFYVVFTLGIVIHAVFLWWINSKI